MSQDQFESEVVSQLEIAEYEFYSHKVDAEYAAYIMDHCGGLRVIHNGNDLITAMEDQFLAKEFIQHLAITRSHA